MKLSPIVALIAATTLLRIGFSGATGLGIDESYMVTAGRVFSLGYFDHPPAAWWLSRGMSWLAGSEDPSVVRLPFILLFALSQFLVWRIGCFVANPKAGFWAVAALNLSPVFGVTTATWILPDGPLDAALLGAVLCLLHALWPGERRKRWWVGAGLCAGLALFSKYTAVLTLGGAFLFLLTSRRHRHWLSRREPYVALALACLVFSPVLIWNAMHGWASFAFQGDRAVGLRFHPLAPLGVLGGEALFVLPWIWLPMILLFIGAFRRNAAWTDRLLAWLAAPPIIGFALISAWSSQRILFHWAAPGYLMLFPLLGEAIAQHLDSRLVRRLIASTTVLVLVALATIELQIQFDWLGGSLASVMHKDPTDEALDWKSVRVDLKKDGLLPPGGVAAAMSWRDAGKFGYALGPDTIMLCLCKDSRQFGFAHPVRDFIGRDVLVLLPDPAEAGLAEAARWFDSVEIVQGTAVRLGQRDLRTVTVAQGHGLHLPQ